MNDTSRRHKRYNCCKGKRVQYTSQWPADSERTIPRSVCCWSQLDVDPSLETEVIESKAIWSTEDVHPAYSRRFTPITWAFDGVLHHIFVVYANSNREPSVVHLTLDERGDVDLVDGKTWHDADEIRVPEGNDTYGFSVG
eukprot:Polyplicarium_translucidae@DN3384_c2_g1_i15.p1